MNERRFDVRGPVLAWTIVTTTFTWTPTMRLLLKPEISRWSLFGLEGVGRTGVFWIFPAVALVALFGFYLQGRGRLRPLFHGLLLAWHLPLTAALLYGALSAGGEASFVGGAWGVEIPFAFLVLPFGAFSALALIWVVGERRGSLRVRERGWGEVDGRKLALAGLLLPVAFTLFRMGEGYDGMVKIAIVACILMWILLAEGLRGPYPFPDRREEAAISPS